ncbi:MAG: hypothetical protein K6C30_04110 [Bacteroidaceae bacterium]|nr:hypothetical protein [Bacteroidaceae bacterium]
MITSLNFHTLEGATEWMSQVPFDLTRQELYSASDLYGDFESDDEALSQTSLATCYDSLVYKHYLKYGKHARNTYESMARTLHDQGIQTALDAFFEEHDSNRCVGIMGGHGLLRSDPMFSQIVFLSKRLTEEGFFMLSGGGPGAMEATHLGAWMAGRSEEETREAVESLIAAADSFSQPQWLPSALRVLRRYPQREYVSLGIPTWLYGHEPSTPFATHIAKFFENSIREDVILTMAFGGIIYTPGSAGTMQEIFQDAVQNHYLSFEHSSPMIFMGCRFWNEEIPVYPLLLHLMQTGKYKNLLLSLSDDSSEVERVLKDFQASL